MIGGVPGGRSTYGVCYGVLSWTIEEGSVGAVDVAGLAAALVYCYDDDEAGSPWTFVLHLDSRADETQHEALRWLFLDGLRQLPWIRKARHLIGVQTSPIEIVGSTVRVGMSIAATSSRRVETDVPVACGIPGYDRAGHELYADELTVDDHPFAWELAGNCAYVSDFDYAAPS